MTDYLDDLRSLLERLANDARALGIGESMRRREVDVHPLIDLVEAKRP